MENTGTWPTQEDVDTQVDLPEYTDGIGIDLGIKTLATMSDGTLVPSRTLDGFRILEALETPQQGLVNTISINATNTIKQEHH